eukprot:TRINITY_DN9157_c0_g2_i1.p1 TRINITY_DN9157_c0_g2~~TRINITY_DN9157_c0_g2_i1.p1  ORF type:complete len:474 (-),score=61.06 TRINITY_DN9157_c0_g2_i1:374-1795(-)
MRIAGQFLSCARCGRRQKQRSVNEELLKAADSGTENEKVPKAATSGDETEEVAKQVTNDKNIRGVPEKTISGAGTEADEQKAACCKAGETTLRSTCSTGEQRSAEQDAVVELTPPLLTPPGLAPRVDSSFSSSSSCGGGPAEACEPAVPSPGVAAIPMPVGLLAESAHVKAAAGHSCDVYDRADATSTSPDMPGAAPPSQLKSTATPFTPLVPLPDRSSTATADLPTTPEDEEDIWLYCPEEYEPYQGQRDAYPSQQGSDAYPFQQERDARPSQQGSDTYSYQQESDAYPYQQESDAYPYQQESDAYWSSYGHQMPTDRWPADAEGCGDSWGDTRTTVMLRNLPNDYTRDMLTELLDQLGFYAKYDFVYLPVDFKRWAGLGYAFINMIDNTSAQSIIQVLNGFCSWARNSVKVCEAIWGEPMQGLDIHLQRYRNSPLMHSGVPDSVRPAVYRGGLRVTFPAPTKAIRPPRLRR